MRFSAFLLIASLPLLADEGMWPYNNFPKDKIKQKYGIQLSDQMLERLRLASVRAGASGSFVSPKGLIFTNHHVVLGCVQEVSSEKNDYVAKGFMAKSLEDERKCPGQEAEVLLKIEDITAKVNGAQKAAAGSPEANRERDAAKAKLENECSSRTGHRCEAVTLYGGARVDLYEYKKYTDVRLVFAPEFDIGFFGGDPDNFTYPRYNLDIGFFRAFENGKPADTPNYLKFSREGVKDKEVVFVSGNPGRTERLLTVAEAEFVRDVRLPYTLDRYQAIIRTLKDYMSKSAENERAAKETLFGVENSFKALSGEYKGLKDPKLMDSKRAEEQKLRGALKPEVWSQIEAAAKEARSTFERRSVLEASGGSELLADARTVLRLPVEKATPAGERLKEFAGSGLASIEHRLYEQSPITPSLESVLIATYLESLQKTLGADDPTVKAALKGRSPKEAAEAYVAGSKLESADERKRLAASVEAGRESKDTMLELARILDGPARAARKQYEDKVEAVLNSAKPKIAEARFKVLPGEPPDATFTLRLSYGQEKGYEDNGGHPIPYATKLGGLYERATGNEPYKLPERWLAAKSRLNLATPFDFVSTADIIGGNSGSPTVNAKGEIVGIVFDGNIESLPGNFEYSEVQARAVHVASQAIVEVLRQVYSADRLLGELGLAAKTAGAGPSGGGQER